VAGGDAFILKVTAASVEDLERLVERLLDFGVPTTSIVFSSPVQSPLMDLPARYWLKR
jgi:Lrp/AsnC family leucine-responsive transcriptional regulator